MQDEYLRFPAVQQAAKLARTTIWRLEKTGQFPARRQLSPNTVGWLRSEIEIWLESRQTVTTQKTGDPLSDINVLLQGGAR